LNKESVIRAFIAVEINETVRAGLEDIQSVLKEANAHVSWVKPGNIHCTLVFLGDIFRSAVDSLAGALSIVADDFKPIEIEVAGLGFFGSERSPRIIWAGGGGEVTSLVKLQEDLVTAVLAAGLKPDVKPFKPHLTIGRVRSNRNATGLVKTIALNKDKFFGKVSVQGVVLMQSALTAAGPEYTRLQSFPLGGK